LQAPTPRRHRRAARLLAVLAAATVVLAGCSPEVQRGWLPGYEDGQVTNHTGRITDLWVNAWLTLLVVGVITWGLMIWCVIVYRKRKGDDRLPVQLRYHVPLEIMYTVLPLLLVGVFFYYTARDMAEIEDVSQEPDVTVQVIGKQWSFDFNYIDDDVHEIGVHAEDLASGKASEELPTLYLPVGERVEIVLDSRDVIHSFWVPAFLYKKDMIPWHTNRFQIVPERVGTYAGKCAELCGAWHSAMLFNVKVVERAEYDAHMQELRDKGQTGLIELEYSRDQHPQGVRSKGEN
jgi:cytochrome c oxidase, subunit II